jgi:hypothetical protein
MTINSKENFHIFLLADIPQSVKLNSDKLNNLAISQDAMHHDMFVKILKPSGLQFLLKGRCSHLIFFLEFSI